LNTETEIPIPFESYSGNKPFAFVSYAHADKVLVYSAMRYFHEANLNIWYDDGIPPAEEWQSEIAQKIMGADMFTVFLSASACASSHVNREIQFALSENKPILPIFLEKITLTPSLKLCLQQFQSCFCFKLDWQKRAIEVIRKALEDSNKLDPSAKPRKKEVEEDFVDESEGLWKIMDQIYHAQITRRMRLKAQRKTKEVSLPDEKVSSETVPSIPVPEAPSRPSGRTRHPFAVGVMVDKPDPKKSEEKKAPFTDPYLGEFSWIPSGRIAIKVPYSEEKRLVHVKNGFWLGQVLVTQEAYTEVMGTNPSHTDTDTGDEVFNLPVNRVSWLDAVEFCKALTALAKISGKLPEHHEFRLPTEVEWEYACRAGTTTDYYFGDDPTELHEHAWYVVNSLRRIHPVKMKAPNPWGLYDLYGNVREWVGNSFVNTLLDESEQDEFRICRGGSYMKKAVGCRSSSRDTQSLFHRYRNLGFRVALSGPPNL
jgi:formylglycine-generating enzyme required for sulfatase activity